MPGQIALDRRRAARATADLPVDFAPAGVVLFEAGDDEPPGRPRRAWGFQVGGAAWGCRWDAGTDADSSPPE